MELTRSTFRKIRQIVGKSHASQAREDRACYAFDATGRTFLPDAVVFPGSAREIAALLKLAGEARFFVVPRGAGSGMTGGALAVQGGVVVVMTRLNRILELDADNLIARVEPGVITAHFQRAVAEKGLFYPPDPSSADFATLGGNVAECAGGPRAVKYGVTRDYVLGLEAVLPTGEIVQTGVRTAKGVVGYDLTRLLVGSEGTLGIITQMTLRLLPLPEAVRTMTAAFASMDAAARTVSEIIRRGIIPRTIEFMDQGALACVAGFMETGLPDDARALLILEVDGTAAEAEAALERLEALCRSRGAGQVRRAADPREAAALWRARKAISPALFRFGPDKINEDIVVPRSHIPDLVRKIDELRRKTGLTMVSFGHAGDGNIHFNIMLDKGDPVALSRAEAAVDELFDYTLFLGGTLSGEHGVGITKAPYVAKEIGSVELALMRRIKAAFDPHGVLNPGKCFPEPVVT